MTNYRRRIAVVYPFGNLETLPTLKAFLAVASAAGVGVDVFARADPMYPDVRDLPSGARLCEVDEGAFSVPLPAPGLSVGSARHHLRTLYWELRRRHAVDRVIRDAVRLQGSSSYSCVIAVDPESAHCADALAARLRLPLVYWSLEIQCGEPSRGAAGWLRRAELTASRKADLWVTQDSWRAELLADKNGLDLADSVLVPNSPLGQAGRTYDSSFRERAGLPAEAFMALSAGSIRPWACSLELAEAASAWSEGRCLLLHSRQLEYRYGHAYVDEVMKHVDSRHVYASFASVPADQYRQVVNSADVGVALYNPCVHEGDAAPDPNLVVMGYSSGKLAMYLMCGLPVIVSDSIGPRDLVRRFACGLVVRSASEVDEALTAIEQDYERFSSNAVRCFSEVLDPAPAVTCLLEKLLEYE